MSATRAKPITELNAFIKRLRLHTVLSEEDAAAIRSLPWMMATRKQNAHLAREGDITGQCTVLLDGYAHRFRLTDEGERQILAIYVPGDPIDFDHLYLPTADDGLQALRDSVLAQVQHHALRSLMAERANVAEAIMRAMLVDSSIFREWTLNVGRRDARARISHMLCEVSTRLEVQGVDLLNTPLPLTQDQIADATGLTPVHVNRTLKSLSADGYLTRRKGLVILPNPRALWQIAGFDPRYLHLQPNRAT